MRALSGAFTDIASLQKEQSLGPRRLRSRRGRNQSRNAGGEEDHAATDHAALERKAHEMAELKKYAIKDRRLAQGS